MELNKLPIYDSSDNPTHCCPRFKSEGWDEQEIHFQDKLFAKATTVNFFHIPINMGRVFSRVSNKIEKSGAYDDDQIAILSIDVSPWKSEHYFAVNKKVPGLENVRLSGDYFTRVFEGPYKDARYWYDEMKSYVKEKGFKPGKVFFFYTTCPDCAKYYGKNYVVGFGEAA